MEQTRLPELNWPEFTLHALSQRRHPMHASLGREAVEGHQPYQQRMGPGIVAQDLVGCCDLWQVAHQWRGVPLTSVEGRTPNISGGAYPVEGRTTQWRGVLPSGGAYYPVASNSSRELARGLRTWLPYRSEARPFHPPGRTPNVCTTLDLTLLPRSTCTADPLFILGYWFGPWVK